MGSFTNRILWAAMVVSLIVYAAVAHIVTSQGTQESPSYLSTLVAVFIFLSVSMGVGTIHYRRRALVNPIQVGQIDLNTAAGQQRAFQPFVMNLMLSESVGIYGLVLAFLSGHGEYYLPFMAGALVLMFLHRPTASDLNPSNRGLAASQPPPPIG